MTRQQLILHMAMRMYEGMCIDSRGVNNGLHYNEAVRCAKDFVRVAEEDGHWKMK